MKPRMIATWKMAFQGVEQGVALLKADHVAGDAVEHGICCVEDEARYCSVGYGGLPNKEGIVELDSAYMDGETLGYGAIMAATQIKNPIRVARLLAQNHVNCVLVGKGAEQFAINHQMEMKEMLTETSKQRWLNCLNEDQKLHAYDGHDTVCMIAKDSQGNLASGVSTSGLFMKEKGRVGDSPIIGSGFYCDNEIGAVAATGLGEDIMRGCLSIRVLDCVRMGMEIQKACDHVLDEHMQRMKRSGRQCEAISLIAMDKEGNYAATTNIEHFPYVIMNDDGDAEICAVGYQQGKHVQLVVDEQWMNAYTGD